MSREKQIIEEMAKVLCKNALTEYCASGRCSNQNCLVNAKALETLYNAGYRKQEWISVDERLPETGTRVVGHDYEGNARCYFIYQERWWIDKGWNTAKGWGITHWMPLPEAPKMKGGAE